MPKVITYSHYPEGCEGGGVVILKNIISGPFNYIEQNGHIKMLIVNFWGNNEHGGGVIIPPITFDY
jgi:hypothetical protein